MEGFSRAGRQRHRRSGTGLFAIRVRQVRPPCRGARRGLHSIAEAKVAFENTGLPAKLARYHDDAESTFRGWNDIWLHPDFRFWNIEEYLPGVNSPVLLIQGEDDQYGTAAQVKAIASQVNGPVETLMLRNCAHSPQVDQMQATVERIAHFVARLGDKPSSRERRP